MMCLSSILGFEPSKRRPFPIKTGVIWVPGVYIYIYVYIYICYPPLESLPFLWVSSVQTAERFLRWKTASVKTIIFVRIIRFILFTLLVLQRSTLFRKGSQY